MTLIPPHTARSRIPSGAPSRPAGATFRTGDLDAMAERCPERTVGAGRCLFREGTPLECVYVVREGLVGQGRRTHGRRVTFLLLHPGDVVGDEAALLGTPARFDTFAVTDAKVLMVPVAQFLDALDLRSPFGRQWAVGLGERIAALQGRLEDLLGGDLRTRIASLLQHELEADSRTVKLTQQNMADLLGVPRTSVTRVLQGLQRQGVIELGYRYIAVRDHGALAKATGRDGASA